MATLVRWLIRLYPPALRRTHGQEIAAAMRADWERSRGISARIHLAIAVAVDVLHCWGRTIGDVRPATLTRGWMADVRNSVRVLRRTPGHIAATVLCLGVGIAASTSVFSLVNALLYRDLAGIVGSRWRAWSWGSSWPCRPRTPSDSSLWASRCSIPQRSEAPRSC